MMKQEEAKFIVGVHTISLQRSPCCVNRVFGAGHLAVAQK